MSLLNRYRKAGGFSQLLKLIETSTPAKRNQLLELIEKEDAAWADMIRVKCLSVEKILSWDNIYLKDILNNMEPRVLAIAISKEPKETLEKISSCMTGLKWNEVKDHVESKSFSEGEIHAAGIRIIQQTRQLEEQGFFRFRDIDPELVVAA